MMRDIFKLLVLQSCVVALASGAACHSAFAADETGAASASTGDVDPEKRALILEYIKLRGDDKIMLNMMDSTMQTNEETFEKSIRQIAALDSSVPADQKEAMIQEKIAAYKRLWSRTRELLINKYDLVAMANGVFISIYAKHFSVDDLKALNEFFKSPIGQKLATETPAIMDEARPLAASTITPKVKEAIDQVLQEEKDKSGQPAGAAH